MLEKLPRAEFPLVANYANKTFLERTTGRFYTPKVIANELIERVAVELANKFSKSASSSQVTVSDPFCGDGRLIGALLFEATKHAELVDRRWIVRLVDIDAEACASAADYVRDVAASLRLNVTIESHADDAFLLEDRIAADAIVTNPPWEHIKPDIREMRHMSPEEAGGYRSHMRARSDELGRRFPFSVSKGQWGGWSINLARCGWELALRSCLPGGVLGIVLPASLFADQASEGIRRFAFSGHLLRSLTSYPAEARLFDKVDQAVVSAVFINSPPKSALSPSVAYFQRERGFHVASLSVTRAALERDGFSLPLGIGAGSRDVLNSLSHLKSIGDLEAQGVIWAGREIDETRILEKLEPGAQYPFIKVRMIGRHTIKELPTLSLAAEHVRWQSVAHERIVWRDVSRPTQARRMICTIVPRGWVAGNSLHVIHMQKDDPEKLRALYAVIASYVFELQVRSRLATAHVSLGVVRSANVPDFSDRSIVRLCEVAGATLSGASNMYLEIEVAKAYGLNRDEFANILGSFPKLLSSERDALLDRATWLDRV